VAGERTINRAIARVISLGPISKNESRLVSRAGHQLPPPEAEVFAPAVAVAEIP
jgi:hypothetical protein